MRWARRLWLCTVVRGGRKRRRGWSHPLASVQTGVASCLREGAQDGRRLESKGPLARDRKARMPTATKKTTKAAPAKGKKAAASAAGDTSSGASAQASAQAGAGANRVLKKYPNRRLYDTRTSSYITLVDVKTMVLSAEAFEVRDAKTGEDLTRSILLQIILEEESGGVPMFSTLMLEQLIRFYGHSMQGLMGTMLEKNLGAFAEMQGRILDQGRGLYDPKHLTPEAWTQFLSGQAPQLQNMMTGYLEQSRALFEQMQRGGGLFPGMAGMPGMPGFSSPKK
jgi:polyhydroxyalkanoate synthesis repressor PhaR